MEITCTHCHKKIQIPDEKVPENKPFSLRCPGCKNRISVNPAASVDPAADAGFEDGKAGGADEADEFAVTGEDYDASEKPFDFLEEEGRTAMVLENDQGIVSQAQKVLEVMDYHVTVPEDVRDALRKMKYHQFDLVLLNETFDSSSPDANGVLIYLQRMTMDTRRQIFVALLTERYETMDRMAAFLKSVNVVIHVKDISQLDRILARAINENELFYAVFKESAKKLGQY
jgi:CheY-like chemotaxis protein